MAQLGFTFYPKDWWTSDSFFSLAPFERYIYLELLFMMYSNDGFVLNNKSMIEGRLRTTLKDDVWVKITDLLVKDGDKLTHKSVNSRLKKAITNRENGLKGGAPEGNNNAGKQPKQPRKTTQNNPPSEREIKKKKKEEEKKLKSLSPLLDELGFISTVDAKDRYLNREDYRISREAMIMTKVKTIENLVVWVDKFNLHVDLQAKKQTMEGWVSYFGNWMNMHYDPSVTITGKQDKMVY